MVTRFAIVSPVTAGTGTAAAAVADDDAPVPTVEQLDVADGAAVDVDEINLPLHSCSYVLESI